MVFDTTCFDYDDFDILEEGEFYQFENCTLLVAVADMSVGTKLEYIEFNYCEDVVHFCFEDDRQRTFKFELHLLEEVT